MYFIYIPPYPNTSYCYIAIAMVKVSINKHSDFIFPFQNIDNTILLSIFCDYEITNRKLKCFGCNKGTKIGTCVAYCYVCRHHFHLKCGEVNKKDMPLPHDWICPGCTMKTLPFGNINDENMKLTIHGFSDDNIDFCVDKCPSFSIQSLLDKMPGQKIDTDQFMSNTILSKYYTASDFLSAKFSNSNFAIFHLNISSLQKHIDDLRTLLMCTNSNFDVICISETRLHNEVPLSNIQIDGYNFIHTPTLTQCGGSGMYIKNDIEFSILDKLTQSHKDYVNPFLLN